MVRLTGRVFDDLAIWMVGFGLLIGVIFPPAVALFGVPAEIAFTPTFFAFCLIAGTAAGGINIVLVRVVVKPRVELMAQRMGEVEEGIRLATYTGDWSHCDPEQCRLDEDSEDALGDAARAFNKMLQALRRSHDVEASIDTFATAMSSQLELQPLCRSAIDQFLEHIGGAAAAVLVDTGGELSLLASHAIEDAGRLAESDHVQRAMRSGEVQRIELPEHLELRGGLVSFRPHEVLVVPLIAHSVQHGVFVLAGSTPLPPESRSLATVFARTFTLALTNAMAHDQLQRIAAIDPLTGCYNRRFGLQRLTEEYQRATRAKGPLSLIMFDIDHFKMVNDTHGHLVGDKVLMKVSELAGQSLRKGDTMVRYGGEEFLAILPGASSEDAQQIAHRIRRAVEETEIKTTGIVLRKTVSVGVTSFPDVRPETEMGLVQVTDHALYAAKQGGRNRVVVGSDKHIGRVSGDYALPFRDTGEQD